MAIKTLWNVCKYDALPIPSQWACTLIFAKADKNEVDDFSYKL